MDGKSEKFKKIFYGNHGRLLNVVSGWCPTWWIITLAILYVHQGSLTAVSVYFGRSDFGLSFEDANMTFLISSSFIGIISCHFQRYKFEILINESVKNMRRYRGIDSKTSLFIKNKRETSEKIKTFYSKLVWGLDAIIIISYIFVRRPFDTYMNGGVEKYARGGEDLPENFVGGIPVPYWHYLDVNNDLNYYFAVGMEYMFIPLLAFSFPALIVFAARMIFHIISEFEILQYILKNSVEISEIKYFTSHEKNKKIDPKIFSSILNSLLKECAQHHQSLLKCSASIREPMSGFFAAFMLGGGLLSCLLGVVIVSPDTGAGIKLASTTSLFTLFTTLFALSWLSEKLSEESRNVGLAIYSSKWLKHPKQMKIYVYMMIERSKKPEFLTMAGFQNLTLETYSSILQSSYSYFNMLMAFQDSEK